MASGISIENIDFNEVLRQIFIMACNIAKDTAKELFESLDDQIRENIDPKRYRFKMKEKKTILTPFGDLTYERGYYLDRRKDEYFYPLDEFMNIKLEGKVTKDVLLRMVDEVASMSYTKCLEDLEQKNIKTSIGTVRNRVMDFLNKVNAQEAQRVEKNLSNELHGKKVASVIFEEKDGLYLKIKGSKKKEGDKGRESI